MGNLLYIIAAILIIIWAIGYVGYSTGGLFHIILVVAVVAIVSKFFLNRRRSRKFF
ncbi:MAG: lmo0937 family membrane protein [Bacteroidetes bacterium]|jgi:ABC-type siderophore export system fused ATPase/permease subunit|nr:lmo0937 family membrane protein [Bacteroidota bacterium]